MALVDPKLIAMSTDAQRVVAQTQEHWRLSQGSKTGIQSFKLA